MKLLIVNGSPRVKSSNSKTIINRWMFPDNNDIDIVYAMDIIRDKADFESLIEYDSYLFIFPLYVDSVPSSLKYVFELMYDEKNKFSGKKAYYIVHSGFPEACHSRGCEKYLKYFTKIMDMECMGVGVFGGSESLQANPPDVFYRDRPEIIKSMGKSILCGKEFTENDLSTLAGIEKLSTIRKLFTRLFNVKFYWNSQLKNNNAYEKRSDRPLID